MMDIFIHIIELFINLFNGYLMPVWAFLMYMLGDKLHPAVNWILKHLQIMK